MDIGEPGARIERVLASTEVKAANELTRRWFASRAEPPAAASGLGLWPLLAVLATGAVGRTRDELLDAAGIDAARADSIARDLLAAARSASAIRLALGVWSGSALVLDPEWVDKLPTDAIGTLTGRPEVDGAALDSWASEHTEGMIERMPVDLEQKIDLLLAGALMVRTTWVTEFAEDALEFRRGPWARFGPCRVLSNVIRDDVLRVTDEVSVLTVPGRDDIDVLLALGREDLAPERVFAALIDAANDPAWGRSSADMAAGERAPGVTVVEYRAPSPQTAPEVSVEAVGFSVSSDLDLIEDASALGLERASDEERAEFDRLAHRPTYVSQARQSCVAEFSATGFEAAAVTTVAMLRAGAVLRTDHEHRQARIVFDRPFAYAARHRPSGLVLIGGWVAEPDRSPDRAGPAAWFGGR
ncbi:MAG TPA: serpin family protein [Glycomyces sp.]|nr:serpin family protein [Glycomyces sp.]